MFTAGRGGAKMSAGMCGGWGGGGLRRDVVLDGGGALLGDGGRRANELLTGVTATGN